MISKEINNNLIHETNLAYLELRTNSKGGPRERERELYEDVKSKNKLDECQTSWQQSQFQVTRTNFLA